jgi:hypothetical protein
MTITALPSPPLPTDTPADFNTKAFAFLGAMPAFVTETNAVASDVTTKQGTASTAATNAVNSATAAGNSATASANSATTASTQAGNASTSAGNALASANAAAASAASITAQVEVAIHSATGKTTPVDADELGITDSAASFGLKKLTWANLKAGVFGAWGALIAAATGKTTPVDADAFAMMDSAASNATKKLTWANLKATLSNEITSLSGLTAVRGLAKTQTVIEGPVDSAGLSNFGGSVGSATLTTAATLRVAAAAGGDLSYRGSIVNPAFTAPGGSGTGFLMLAVTSAGAVTASVRTLVPVYQWGGTYSTASGQLTFNIQEMTAKAGNGSVAAQVYEVCIGECPYTAGVWSGSPVWYALMGRYDSGLFAVTTSTAYSKNHNLGVVPKHIQVFVADDTTGTNERAIVGYFSVGGNTFGGAPSAAASRTSLRYTTAPVGVSLDIALGALANGAYRYVVKRGW